MDFKDIENADLKARVLELEGVVAELEDRILKLKGKMPGGAYTPSEVALIKRHWENENPNTFGENMANLLGTPERTSDALRKKARNLGLGCPVKYLGLYKNEFKKAKDICYSYAFDNSEFSSACSSAGLPRKLVLGVCRKEYPSKWVGDYSSEV